MKTTCICTSLAARRPCPSAGRTSTSPAPLWNGPLAELPQTCREESRNAYSCTAHRPCPGTRTTGACVLVPRGQNILQYLAELNSSGAASTANALGFLTATQSVCPCKKSDNREGNVFHFTSSVQRNPSQKPTENKR